MGIPLTLLLSLLLYTTSINGSRVKDALSTKQVTHLTTSTILPTPFFHEKVNPPFACPLTNQGVFLAGPGTACSSFTNLDGITGITLGFVTVDPTFLFLPMVPCATVSTQTYFLGGLVGCSFAFVTGQTSVSTRRILFSDITSCQTTTDYTTICVYPAASTITVTPIVGVGTQATAFIDVPTFTTSTSFLSATFTITTTRTSSLTTTTLTTNTVTVLSKSVVTSSTTSTITFSEDVFDDETASTTTTTFLVSTSASLTVSTIVTNMIASSTVTITRTTCQNALLASPHILRQDRVEQVQCPVPFAGSVYNSNIGSSISTVCNVAGATQLLTSEPLYNQWLWSMIKTYTPCAYAATDTVFWIGSSTGTCYALQSTTTTTRPCTEVHPVVCVNTTTDQVDNDQVRVTTAPTSTFFDTSTTIIVTRTSTITLTQSRTIISSNVITVPTFTTTTQTLTRNTELTTTTTSTVTATGYTLTTTTSTVSDVVDTTTVTLSSFIFTRTITSESTFTLTDTISTTITTTTENVNSCPITFTRTVTFFSTYSTVITILVPIYSTTIYTTDSQCFIPETTTWATSGCGCANAPAQ